MKWLMILFGYRYLVNTHTREVHDLKKETSMCRINLMSRSNKVYVTRKQLINMKNLRDKVNGCRWCMSSTDTDKW